jgi:hypothetical protein
MGTTRAVWSYLSKPYEARQHEPWLSEKHHLLSWMLSTMTLALQKVSNDRDGEADIESEAGRATEQYDEQDVLGRLSLATRALQDMIVARCACSDFSRTPLQQRVGSRELGRNGQRR